MLPNQCQLSLPLSSVLLRDFFPEASRSAGYGPRNCSFDLRPYNQDAYQFRFVYLHDHKDRCSTYLVVTPIQTKLTKLCILPTKCTGQTARVRRTAHIHSITKAIHGPLFRSQFRDLSQVVLFTTTNMLGHVPSQTLKPHA